MYNIIGKNYSQSQASTQILPDVFFSFYFIPIAPHALGLESLINVPPAASLPCLS